MFEIKDFVRDRGNIMIPREGIANGKESAQRGNGKITNVS
jgi:hypothetical protein